MPKKTQLTVIFAAIAAPLAIGSLVMKFYLEPTVAEVSTNVNSAKTQGSRIFQLGQTAKHNGFAVTIHKARKVSKEGKSYIVINTTFKNISNKNLSVSELILTEVWDSAGRKHSLELESFVPEGVIKKEDGFFISLSQSPGEQRKGPLVYKVPNDSKGLKWIYFEQNVKSERNAQGQTMQTISPKANFIAFDLKL